MKKEEKKIASLPPALYINISQSISFPNGRNEQFLTEPANQTFHV